MAESGQRGLVVPHMRAWRLSRFFTQAELAERAAIARGTVARAEHGESISVPNVRKLAAALGVTPQKLVSEEPKKAVA